MTEIALRQENHPSAPASLVEWAGAASAAHQIAAPLIATDFVPAHFRPKGSSDEALRTAQYAATAAVLTGAELGLSPMQSLQGIYVIGGKPALYARMMQAVVMAAGHELWVEESTDNKAVVSGRRRGSSHEERVVVTMDMARKAGWTSNKKYQSEPDTMLLARAYSRICRRIAPDALAGVPYSVEELEDENAPTTTVTRAADAPKRTAKRAQAAPVVVEEPPLDDPEPPTTEAVEGITAPQLKKLHVVLGENGMSTREDALRYLSRVIGREITSSKDLTKAEASEVIDALDTPQEPAEPTLDEGAWPETAQVPS